MFKKLIKEISVRIKPDFRLYLKALDNDELLTTWEAMKSPDAISGEEAPKMIKREIDKRFDKDISDLL